MRACIPMLAWLAALFSTLGVLLWRASAACLERGGKTSDTAWVCELPGATGHEAESLWAAVGWPDATLAALLVGLPVFLLVRRLGRRWDTCSVPRRDPADTSPGSH